MADFIGSSGTLIGAALETAGYYYQSWALDALGSQGLSNIGGLLYIVGALVAIVTVVLYGHYKLGAWFFLGPGLFMSMVIPRTETSGVLWKFGTETRPEQQVLKLTEEYKGNNPYTPRISSMFAAYNNLVSGSVNAIVAALNKEREKVDLTFVYRAQLNALMKTPVITEAGLRDLIHRSLLNHCKEMVEAGKEMADPHNPEEDQEKFKQKYKELSEKQYVKITQAAAMYIASLEADYPNVVAQLYTTTPDEEIQNLNNGCYTTSTANCVLPPANVGQASASMVQSDQNARAAFPNGVINPDDPAFPANLEQVRQRDQQIAEISSRLEGQTFKCLEIWNFAFLGIHHEALLAKLRAGALAGQDRQLTEEEFKKHFDPFKATINEDQIYRMIAKNILRNEVIRGSMPSIIADYAEKGKRINQMSVPAESELIKTERIRSYDLQYAERTKLMASAASLPYYQGLALYFLAVAYPFFAFLLIVPGKHAGFLLWFLLWFWVKSWDVGFAAVMLLDDVLHSLFVFRQTTEGLPNKYQLSADLSVAMTSLREYDPTFQIGTYYSIVAVALHSVPVMMSYLIMGSAAGGAGLIAGAQGRWSGVSNGSFGNGGGLSQASLMAFAQKGLNKERQDLLEGVMSRAMTYRDTALQSGGGIGDRGGNGLQGLAEPWGDGFSTYAAEMRKGHTMGMTGQAAFDLAEKLGWASGFSDGLKTSMVGNMNPLNQFGNRARANAVRDAVFGGAAKVGNATTDALLALTGDRLRISAATAVWDEINSVTGQASAQGNAYHRSLPIPYSASPPAGAEMEQYRNEFKQGMNILSASASAADDIIKATTKRVDQRFNPFSDKQDRTMRVIERIGERSDLGLPITKEVLLLGQKMAGQEAGKVISNGIGMMGLGTLGGLLDQLEGEHKSGDGASPGAPVPGTQFFPGGPASGTTPPMVPAGASGAAASGHTLSYAWPNNGERRDELTVAAARSRLERRVSELKFRGVSGGELEEAEALLDREHSSEASYDEAYSRIALLGGRNSDGKHASKDDPSLA